MARPFSGIAFTKMQGLGNDFVVVDLRSAAPDWFDEPGNITALCDRRYGVGADGVLAILPATETAQKGGATARMRVRNSDGSEAEMCGNGLRCVAQKLLGESGETLRIETGAGLLDCLRVDETQIEVAMGAPRWDCVQVPFAVGDAIWSLTTVSMGNPHAVIFCETGSDPQALRLLAERYGPLLERHKRFPNRTNVEFVYSQTRERYVAAVWERGCGITLACGTGACATAVAACLTGRAEPDTWLTVQLLGGPLQIRIEPDYTQVTVRGPAVTVYSGTLT